MILCGVERGASTLRVTQFTVEPRRNLRPPPPRPPCLLLVLWTLLIKIRLHRTCTMIFDLDHPLYNALDRPKFVITLYSYTKPQKSTYLKTRERKSWPLYLYTKGRKSTSPLYQTTEINFTSIPENGNVAT